MSPNIHRSIMEKSYFVHSRTDRCQNDGGAPVPPMFSALKNIPFRLPGALLIMIYQKQT